MNAEFVNLQGLQLVSVEDTADGRRVKVELPKFLLEDINCFISVPVLKMHAMTTVTNSIKNLWGCYPDTMGCLHHKNVSHRPALLTWAFDPRIVPVDGTLALNGYGPTYGVPRRTNLISASSSPVAADSLTSSIMEISAS